MCLYLLQKCRHHTGLIQTQYCSGENHIHTHSSKYMHILFCLYWIQKCMYLIQTFLFDVCMCMYLFCTYIQDKSVTMLSVCAQRYIQIQTCRIPDASRPLWPACRLTRPRGRTSPRPGGRRPDRFDRSTHSGVVRVWLRPSRSVIQDDFKFGSHDHGHWHAARVA